MNYLDKCTFCRLNEGVVEACEEFECTHSQEIHNFFKSEFVEYEREMLGKSYCFVTDTTSQDLVCAFTVANSSIRLDLLPKRRRNKINRSIPNPKRNRQYPAVLVGQLAVFDKFRGLGIGKEILDFIKGWFKHDTNKTGCRYIVVDAVNTPKVIKYYLDNGFELMFSSDKEELEYYRKEKQDILQKEKFCKTRLMFFELMNLNAT